MNGDIIYCEHCKNMFLDTMRTYKDYRVQDVRLEDSRVNDRYKNMCPFCLSRDTFNASKILIEGDRLSHGVFGTLGNWNKRSWYKRLKKVAKSKGLYKTDDIEVM